MASNPPAFNIVVFIFGQYKRRPPFHARILVAKVLTLGKELVQKNSWWEYAAEPNGTKDPVLNFGISLQYINGLGSSFQRALLRGLTPQVSRTGARSAQGNHK